MKLDAGDGTEETELPENKVLEVNTASREIEERRGGTEDKVGVELYFTTEMYSGTILIYFIRFNSNSVQILFNTIKIKLLFNT